MQASDSDWVTSDVDCPLTGLVPGIGIYGLTKLHDYLLCIYHTDGWAWLVILILALGQLPGHPDNDINIFSETFKIKPINHTSLYNAI